MGVITKYRLAEEIKSLLDGGNIPEASSISFNEIKISIGQVANALLKMDYIQINGRLGETIPNGSMLGLYEDIECTKWRGKSTAMLPIKPVKLPRNMGVWSIFPSDEPDNEFIPISLGQASLIQSQPLISDILGQVGYEVYGDRVVFTRDLTPQTGTYKVSMRLVIMDINQYSDYDPLPLLPEMEWEIKKQVFQLYANQPLPDKLVDSTVKENKNTPLKQQQQS